MGELDALLAAAADCEARGESHALATVVAVRGSSYRRPGARLLVPAQAAPVGIVSGGCLEDEAARLARAALAAGAAPRLATIDHSEEGDEIWGSGLGCRGAIELLIEPPGLARDTVAALRAALEEGRGDTLVTVLASTDEALPPGTRLRPAQATAALIGRDAAATVRSAGDAGRPRVVRSAGLVLAVDPIRAPLQLLVCGAGPDAEPLVHLARELGWRVVVADWRRRVLNPARFAGARMCDAEPALAGAAVGAGRETAAVLMTHDYLRDAEYLRGLLGREVAYLGVLGPRDRTERLLDHLAVEGVRLDAADRARLHAPAGLDLAADGPAEVATAIVAEIVAAIRGRSAEPLRDRPGPIHGEAARQPPM